jgi:hypothetical protein
LCCPVLFGPSSIDYHQRPSLVVLLLSTVESSHIESGAAINSLSGRDTSLFLHFERRASNPDTTIMSEYTVSDPLFYSLCCRGCLWLGLGGSGDYLNAIRIIFASFRPFRRLERQRKEHVACASPASRPLSRPCPENCVCEPAQAEGVRDVGCRSKQPNGRGQHQPPATPPHSAHTQQRRGVDNTQTVGNGDIFRPVTCEAVDRQTLASANIQPLESQPTQNGTCPLAPVLCNQVP